MTLLKVEQISFQYSTEKMLIDKLSFEVLEGESLGIIGPNGCGKTTLLKLILGILKPIKGIIYLEGMDISKMTLGKIGESIGYVMQNPERQLFMPSVAEEITYALHIRGWKKKMIQNKLEEMIDFFDLKELEHVSPFTLSGGEKQILALAAVSVLKPRLLILDEPTTGLDPLRKAKLGYFLKKLQKNGLGLILVSHDLSFVKNFCSDTLSFYSAYRSI
ncbi:energy-coupling factor transporter ATP-binding protein EcfA2 [Clostridium ragsdalei P11]|uniref:Energy-coupling factor transporter ATP-binding protein EcfA2 n=1 Tax=Clostridium ragsdalei P11 TaxID=1353534 RepID=A0A1A6AL33_9CLOT|nr:ABC transporter ATP-binding protein [Clostridium ragsdalei]OBR90761.1 energy-coupling factor transporter ATP-binding protein EcfA2 [Clostridium ragsdalei P11]